MRFATALIALASSIPATGLGAPSNEPPPSPASATMTPDPAAAVIEKFFSAALTTSPAHEQLRELTTRYPGRLSGSKNLERAIVWAEQTLNALALDRVWKQDVLVPHWERGPAENVLLLPSADTASPAAPLAALALGGSVPTPGEGITAGVVEVHSLDELSTLGREKLAGKIIFFNRPLDPTLVNSGLAYGQAGDQRNRGPGVAATFGAVAALTRSLTHARDDVPHTGSTSYTPDGPRIPAAALSTLASIRLSSSLAADPSLRVQIKIHSRTLPDTPSHNVIGEIRGTEFPDKIILVGGHLDCWDVAPGAHDDGAGVVQSIEVLRLFKTLGIRPRHTLRCVLFTNEENGLRGATAYASAARASGEKHILALESDNGGFQPRGFNFGSTQIDAAARARRWLPLFEPFGLSSLSSGRGGADVAPLMLLGTTVAGLTPDSQRYLDVHHTALDSIDQVNPRELHIGAAALAALIYLFDTQEP